MPTLNFNLKKLMKLSRVYDYDKLTYVIRQFKGEIKGIYGDEITVELEPDRPDIMCIEGLARAIRNFLEIEIGHGYLNRVIIEQPILEVYVKDVKVRPYIACAVIKGIDIDDEFIKDLMNMQEALHITLGRNRRKVAIGIHDYDKIYPPITYTEVDINEKMIPLDVFEEMSLREILFKHPKGKIYGKLLEGALKYPVYMDAKGIFSFPPIINGERTRVTESTKNLFIELTGIDENTVNQSLNIIVCNILERSGVMEKVILHYPTHVKITPDLNFKIMNVNVEEFNRLIGLSIDVHEAKSLLMRMGYIIDKVNMNEKLIVTKIPPYRVDILHHVDIIEDMAIAYGYDNILPELPKLMTIGKPSPIEILENKIRELMIGMGFQEVITFTLTNSLYQTKFMNIDDFRVLKLINPVTEEYNCYRRWIIPNLLHFFSQNRHVSYPQRIFEIGYIAIPLDNDIIVQRNLAVGISNYKATFSEIKEVLVTLMDGLGVNVYVEESSHPSFISGRVGIVKVDNREIGLIGELHPKVLSNFEIEIPVSIFEITHSQPIFPQRNSFPLTLKDKLIAKWLKLKS
ncbi:MAG: phenylalanine--tRNA ligase subunit beta [Candidatus Methanomethylicia archaeon]|nr:phenylalanine--tRNA ligase subunit beta [Candidatus Methanomethylicia archaeon]MCX8169231.1 phenylalanine--tRNA ligase subunit beta [Candidatus Methanomethylicia archaeon]MDW7988987.1 phenylalanine--tRNA ligase subunit beta [Nitrososphaerota archaeon]